jgi:hypothetical protein
MSAAPMNPQFGEAPEWAGWGEGTAKGHKVYKSSASRGSVIASDPHAARTFALAICT